MLNSGKKFALLTLVLSEKKILNETKNPVVRVTFNIPIVI